MRSMLGRLGFVGLWVAGCLLPSALYFDRGDVAQLSAGREPGTARTTRLRLGLGTAQAADLPDQLRLQQEAQAAYQRGILAVQRGDTATAEAAWVTASDGFRRLIAQNPQRTELYATLADIQIRRGQPAAAYALLIQQARGAKDLSVHIQLVRALQAMRRPQKALTEAQELIKSNPGNPEVMALLGEVAAEAGNTDLAISELKRAVGRIAIPDRLGTTDGVHVRKLLAGLLLEKQRAGEAVALLNDLNRALPADQHDTEVQLLLGAALLRSGKATEAVVTLRRYLQGSPNSPRAQALLGQALAETGQVQPGIELLEKAGDHPEVLLSLGRLYLRRQPPDAAAAQAVLARAATAQPQSLRICIEYASLLQQTQQLGKALAEITRCTAPLLAPPAETAAAPMAGLDGAEDHLRALMAREALELKVGKFDDALLTLRAALQLVTPGSAMSTTLRGQLAQVLMRRGLAHLPAVATPGNPALFDLQEAYKLQAGPNTGQALALGHLSAGNPADALQLLTPLVDTNPNDPRLLGAYGRALRENGQLVESRQTLQKAEAMVTTAGAAPAGANVGLKAALRQELALTFMALKKPVEALHLLDGSDDTTQQLRAQANIVSARVLFEQAGVIAPPQGPPVPGAPPTPPPPPRGMPDIAKVRFVTQAALKAGPGVLPVQRAEAKLWQVQILHGTGQDEVASKLLEEIAKAFDQPTLESLLGPGGFGNLQAQVTLLGGDIYQGVTIAQQAIPRLSKEAARVLQNAMAFAFTTKAIELASRNEYERANSLMRSATMHTPGGPPINTARAQYNLGVLQILRNRPEDGRLILSKLDPLLFPEAMLGLGAYYDAVGDSRQALDAYRRFGQLLSTNPWNPRPPYAEKVQQWVETLSRIYDSPRVSVPTTPTTSGREHRRLRKVGRGARVAAPLPEGVP